ncbi:hypothetical protein TNCT_173551 [Trichonephila clavata]|uniref:Uncharacterized protein n=1 Tax=Trichonephila clavata TaxID=2740835 RepID=A0A8X6GL72_TRICU|nr:hypothetical protein TNCT_173551 [Trichonephila clavata]
MNGPFPHNIIGLVINEIPALTYNSITEGRLIEHDSNGSQDYRLRDLVKKDEQNKINGLTILRKVQPTLNCSAKQDDEL